MKLRKIISTKLLQCYTIINPSKSFKEKFPKKYIYMLSINSNNILIENTNSLYLFMLYSNVSGYIFTYEKSIIIKSPKDINHNIPKIFSKYFAESNYVSNDKPCPILSVSPIVTCPPLITKPIVIELKTYEKGLNKSQFKKVILNEITETIESNLIKINNVEDWIKLILVDKPFIDDEYPFIYPNTINNKCFTSKWKLRLFDMYARYDYKPFSRNEEIEFIKLVDSLFINPNQFINIYDTFSNVRERIKKNIKNYKEHDNYISVKYKDLCDSNIEFTIGDFI